MAVRAYGAPRGARERRSPGGRTGRCTLRRIDGRRFKGSIATWGPIGIVVLVALAVRLTYILRVTQHLDLGFDSAYYDLVARALREGHGFVDPFAFYFGGREVPTALFPPGYPVALYLLALPFEPTHLTHLVISAVFGATTAGLVCVLARRLLGGAAGLLAGLVAAVHPMLFGADGALMSESLYGVLVVAVLLLAYETTKREHLGWFAALAVVVGIAALIRGEGILLTVVPLLAVRRLDRRRALRTLAMCAVIVLALQVPWMLRNRSAFGTWVAGSNNSSTVLGGANCDSTYYGDKLGFWDFDCLGADRPGWMEMSEKELNDQIRDEGIEYLADNTGRVPVVAAVRLLRTWGLYDPMDQMRLEEGEGRIFRYQVAGWVASLVTLPLAIAGFVLMRRRGHVVWPLVTMLAVVSLSSIATYGNQRFRLAAEPALIIGAVAFVLLVVRRRRVPAEP